MRRYTRRVGLESIPGGVVAMLLASGLVGLVVALVSLCIARKVQPEAATTWRIAAIASTVVCILSVIVWIILSVVDGMHRDPAQPAGETATSSGPSASTPTSVSFSPAPRKRTVMIAGEVVSSSVYGLASEGCAGARIEVELSASAEVVELQLGLDDLSAHGRSVVARGAPTQGGRTISSISATKVTVEMTDGTGMLYLEATPAQGTDCDSAPVLVTVSVM